MMPFGSAASPLLSPIVRGAHAGDPCTLRPPRLAGDTASGWSSSSSPSAAAEHIACDDPLIADLIRMGAVRRPKLVFRGWGTPAEEWKAWVRTMAARPDNKFVEVWRAAGIDDAIFNSTVNIRRAAQTVLAVAGFWCSSTSTFVLPWGEVGFTLEDAHVLGNLPVWGAPLRRPLTVEEERLQFRLVEVREMLRRKMHCESGGLECPRVTRSQWLHWFVKLGEDDDELQHLGFLTYWLSKSVLTCKSVHEPPSVVFGVAARLSRGERIALASAVTASIYSDLTTITKSLYASLGRKEVIDIQVWAQFRLLQAWLWERFHYLSPQPPGSINHPSRVRIARWDNEQRQMSYYEAVGALYSKQFFDWRPYIDDLMNWVKPKWYTIKEEKSILVNEQSPTWVHDFLAIVSASGLVGLASGDTLAIGQYKPYRVSMQLGYDQAIPTSTDHLVTPWDSITMCPTGIELYIPPMSRQCVALEGYDEWWNYYVGVLKMVENDFNRKMRRKRKSIDASNEDNSESVCSQSDLKRKTRKKEKANDANNEDDSKNVSSDGEMNEFRLPADEPADNDANNEDNSESVLKDDDKSEIRLPGDVKPANDANDEGSSENVSKDDNTKKERLAGDVEVEHVINNEENFRNLSRGGNIEKSRLTRDVKIEKRRLTRDVNTEERRLPGDVELENRSVRQGESNFVQKPTNSTKEFIMKMLDDEALNRMIIENERWEDVEPKDQELGPDTHKGAGGEADFNDVLIGKLEELLTHGLQAELSDVSSPSSNGSSEGSAKHDQRNTIAASLVGDHPVEEIMRKYPKFVDMIPPCPRSFGLLQSNVDEGMKKIVYTTLLFKLVELMQKAKRTMCQTAACEIKQLTKEAQHLEKLGFDVSHLISQLNQPEKRLQRLDSAEIAPEEPRERAEKQSSLLNISRTRISRLWKAVKDEDMNVFERE